jgi:hypothetical protein
MGLSDESMRDKIAEYIYTHVFSMGEVTGIEEAADAIIEALPSMVKPLVWVHSYYGEFIHDTKHKYEIHSNASGGRIWQLTKVDTGGWYYIGHYPSAAIAQAAADTYHVADVMEALTGETTHGKSQE